MRTRNGDRQAGERDGRGAFTGGMEEAGKLQSVKGCCQRVNRTTSVRIKTSVVQQSALATLGLAGKEEDFPQNCE